MIPLVILVCLSDSASTVRLTKRLSVLKSNNNLLILNNTNRKGISKDCGDDIGQDSDSDMFCSEQCGVEYQMEHDRK